VEGMLSETQAVRFKKCFDKKSVSGLHIAANLKHLKLSHTIIRIFQPEQNDYESVTETSDHT